MLQTEWPFTLPCGYLDGDGVLHREGVMRRATAYDEIAPLKDPRVVANSAYVVLIVLSRVIVKLGTLGDLNPRIVEGFFAADLAYLQDLYSKMNGYDGERLVVACPHCHEEFEVEAAGPGMKRYPSDRLHEEVAYVAYHLHWSYGDLMHMEHHERRRWVDEVAALNRRAGADADAERASDARGERSTDWAEWTDWTDRTGLVCEERDRAERMLMAETAARHDPYGRYRFRVEIEGLDAGGFSEVRGLEAQIDVLSYREGGENEFEYKLPGPTSHPSSLQLRRGLTDSELFWDWLVQVGRGIVIRRNLTITLLAATGEPAMLWDCRAAFPIRWSGPELDAASGAIALEAVELAHHGLSRPRGLSLITNPVAAGGRRVL